MAGEWIVHPELINRIFRKMRVCELFEGIIFCDEGCDVVK